MSNSPDPRRSTADKKENSILHHFNKTVLKLSFPFHHLRMLRHGQLLISCINFVVFSSFLLDFATIIIAQQQIHENYCSSVDSRVTVNNSLTQEAEMMVMLYKK